MGADPPAYIVLPCCWDKEGESHAFPGIRRLSVADCHRVHLFRPWLVKWQRGLEAAADSFAAMGLPGWLAYIVTMVELAGGWAMMLGLGTRPIAAAFEPALGSVKAKAPILSPVAIFGK